MPTPIKRAQRRITAPIYSLGYGLISLSGVLYIVQPAQSIIDAMGTTLHAVWAVFVALGAGISGASFKHRLTAQYMGLPLLITAYALLGGSFLFDSHDGIPRPAGFLFAGLAGLMHAQWRRVKRERDLLREIRATEESGRQ